MLFASSQHFWLFPGQTRSRCQSVGRALTCVLRGGLHERLAQRAAGMLLHSLGSIDARLLQRRPARALRVKQKSIGQLQIGSSASAHWQGQHLHR